MRRLWVRRALLLATALAIAGAWALTPRGDDARPSPSEPRAVGPSTDAAPLACRRDPANLPTPVGPDGQPANYLHTCGTRLFDAEGREVRITGINWSGMEHGDRAPAGLSSRNWQSILDQVAALGYNTIRVPFSNDTLASDRQIGNVDFSLNPDLQGLDGLEMLDRVVAGARDRGLKVILDRHYVSSGNLTTLWYTAEVPEERWIADWRMLAARYYGDDTVIGVDLHNEPHGEATWGTGDSATDWRLAAERAGNAVLEVNPYLLIFVQGIEHYQGGNYWWGGDLQGVRTAPVRLAVPNRLVYSPHDYGPSISPHAWFWEPSFPDNLPEIWDRHWGYIHREGLAPVVVGEFGGRSLGDDHEGRWQRALLAYLRAHELGAIAWSLNPNWDTGGLFANDWRTVDDVKQDAYQGILAPPLDTGPLGVFGRAPTRYRLLFRQEGPAERPEDVVFSFQIANNGRDAVDLSRFEVRYWLASAGADPGTRRLQIEAEGSASQHVRVEVVEASGDGRGPYLRARFDPAAGALAGYQASTKVTVRFHRGEVPIPEQTADYSYAPSRSLHEQFGEWERATLYVDGQLAAGREP